MIFIKSVLSKTKTVKMQPLSNQFIEHGTVPVNTSLFIQCEKDIRTKYSVHSVYCVDDLEDTGKGYYRAIGDIRVLNSTASPEHIATESQFEAYELYIKMGAGMTRSVESSPSPSVKEEPSKSKSRPTVLSRIMANKKLAAPTIEEDGFYVDPKLWYLLVRNAQQGINTMFYGPTGTGKTELNQLLCKKLSIEFRWHDMGSMHDPIAGLLGVHRLEEGGVSIFDFADFTKDVQSPGMILLDELSRAPVTTNNILFPCLDSRKTLPIDIAGSKDARKIAVHKGVIFNATANVGSEYTGTLSMDRALTRRFFPVEVDYLTAVNEINVLMVRTGIDKSSATKVVAVCNNLRAMYNKQTLSATPSTGESLQIAEMIVDGFSVIESLEQCLLPLYSNEGLENSERRNVQIVLSSK